MFRAICTSKYVKQALTKFIHFHRDAIAHFTKTQILKKINKIITINVPQSHLNKHWKMQLHSLRKHKF